ncbi:Alpha/Beta hydrolase protein [Hypoxylon rubiginosum]|uniref:Alpha/Beta hydrolase protein n=1 Tax=Hypoxylon rubiginosum TaxID=110542 RepID=A0ACC0D2C3_9PEZI|nr:Alpha/Beta hydrolase protein [Hypoxylon rubiginosum]
MKPGRSKRLSAIIAVHGLSGSWRTTWSAGASDDPAIWLRDRLPAVLARINVRPRIRAFGYDSSYVFTSSTSDLESCAEDLLTRIRIARQTEEEKQAPIVFVAHSLGGLIVKLAINLAHTDNEYHQDVLERTTGCLFLAVPFHGADAASWAELASQIVSSLSLGMAGNPELPNALKRNSKKWTKISSDFVQRGKNMTFRSAYETEKMGRSTIVDEASVRNNVPNERVFPVPGSNHRNICQFSDNENERFGPIGLAMVEVVQAALDG